MLFVALVMVAIALAVAERVYALRNERRLLRCGAREIAPVVFRVMAPVYALVFVAALVEHLRFERRPPAGWVAAAVLLFLASKALKLWAVTQLGRNWTMKVVLPESLTVVTSGPYRYIRHPNYIAVIGEIVALPLAGGAWITALCGGAGFILILAFRIRTEEKALMAHPEYRRAMGRKGRFLPGDRGD